MNPLIKFFTIRASVIILSCATLVFVIEIAQLDGYLIPLPLLVVASELGLFWHDYTKLPSPDPKPLNNIQTNGGTPIEETVAPSDDEIVEALRQQFQRDKEPEVIVPKEHAIIPVDTRPFKERFPEVMGDLLLRSLNKAQMEPDFTLKQNDDGSLKIENFSCRVSVNPSQPQTASASSQEPKKESILKRPKP